jgi:hypothetical protein
LAESPCPRIATTRTPSSSRDRASDNDAGAAADSTAERSGEQFGNAPGSKVIRGGKGGLRRPGSVRMRGERDFVVLVDLGDEDEGPLYWIIPAATAQGLYVGEQIRLRNVEEFEGRWDLLG